MKKFILRFILLTCFFYFQTISNAFAFNPDSLLEVQVGTNIKKIESGVKCTVLPFLNSMQIQNPHFQTDSTFRSLGRLEFFVKASLCSKRTNVIRTFSDKPYLVSNEKPFEQQDVKNISSMKKPEYVSHALTIYLEGGLYIKMIFLNSSPMNSFLITPLNNSDDSSSGGLSIADLNQMFDGYLKFVPRQEVISHDADDE
ncbi:MAG: hypothetical protein ACXVCY_13405 [Pseudobdellovibrionaceae bacterium]